MAISSSTKKYNKQHIIPLDEVKLQSLEDNGQYRNGWLIYTRTKSFSVYAATATEKQEWMAHIDKCIRDLLHNNGSATSANLGVSNEESLTPFSQLGPPPRQTNE